MKPWRALIGIIDGIIMAYDSQFLQLLGMIPDTKVCHVFAVNEKSYTIVVANKKKLSLFGWQVPGFVLRREFNLNDIPKSLLFSSVAVVIGYRKFYDCLDLMSANTSRI